jgi:hypothetical protein
VNLNVQARCFFLDNLLERKERDAVGCELVGEHRFCGTTVRVVKGKCVVQKVMCSKEIDCCAVQVIERSLGYRGGKVDSVARVCPIQEHVQVVGWI